MRDIVVITRSSLRCQMLFVVFVMCVVFQVRLAWDRTGVNVNGMAMEWSMEDKQQDVCFGCFDDDVDDVDDAFMCALSQ